MQGATVGNKHKYQINKKCETLSLGDISVQIDTILDIYLNEVI